MLLFNSAQGYACWLVSGQDAEYPRIWHAQEPLRKHYQEALEQHHATADKKEFQAGLACQRWAKTIGDILAVAQDKDALRRLKLFESENTESDNRFKRDLAATFMALLVRMSSNRAWSLSSLWEVPPEQWCGLLSSNENEAALAWEQLKGDMEAVDAAQRAAAQAEHAGMKADLLLAWLQ